MDVDFAPKLRVFLQSAVPSRSYARLRSSVLDHFGGLVACDAWGMYLLDEGLRARDVACRCIPDAFLDRYEELGRDIDPVMHAVVERHRPAHNLQVCTPEGWRHEPLFQHVSSRFRVEHILTAPLLGEGKIIGTLNCGRFHGHRSFGQEDVEAIATLASHVSALLARLPHAGQGEGDRLVELTSRETEIARLVAAGLNNLEIARCLCISRDTVKAVLKRMFQKLDVSARAEMVSRLAAAGAL